MQKAPKPKKCRVCKEEFKPWSTTQVVCSGKCAIELTRLKNEKAYKARTRELRKQHRDRDRDYQRQRAVYWFNRFIRLRDRELPCISCGKTANRYDAGHYKTAGAHPELRFNELNCHKQCSKNCNKELSGNIINYRIRLVEKIGIEAVEWLEGPHEVPKVSIDDYKQIQSIYKAKCKAIEAEIQRCAG